WFSNVVSEGDLLVFVNGSPHGWFEDGITSRKFAALVTVIVIFLFAWSLANFAKHLGLPGPHDPRLQRLLSLPIKLITKSDNRASLSQFQIMLWTFVVAGGAVYVVVLSGSLIPVSESTLVLLGISGGVA